MCSRCDRVKTLLRANQKRAAKLTAIALEFLPIDEIPAALGVSEKTVQRVSKKLLPLALPPYNPPSPSPSNNISNKHDNKTDKLSNTNIQSYIASDFTPRHYEIWDLLQTVEFATTAGSQTLYDNALLPVIICKTLGSEDYADVDAGREFRAAAAWTASKAANRKKNLGAFMLNWFKRAQQTAEVDKRKETGYVRPAAHKVL